MGVFGGPNVSEDGLVLALDAANFKSFKGEVTTNLIPNPTVNAYPTTGNAWGTYNTNQYGSGTYFSIGTVSNVTSNIITMTSAHSLRTYDVMNPQSTGGGVNAGTNYFIKKVSDTSFTLHEYNGSQDGSQGYINSSTGNHKVYDSIANDTRISVNSTNFPTMWWGYPHQPNSGLVKELRYGEFNAIPNLPANDCIRLHYIRTDDVKDGMSYGVDCTVTPSSPVTVSFYTRAANANAVGKVIQYQIYNYTGGNAAGYALNFTLGAVGVWERQTLIFTPAYGTMISYWFSVSGGVYAWDWSCMQVEQKSYVTSFIAGTRGATVATGGGWADLTGNGNNGELVNGVRESSANGGSLSFDGSNDYVTLSEVLTNSGNLTYCAWVYRSVVSPNGYTNLFTSTTQNEQFQLDLTGYPGGFGVYLNGAYNSNTSNLIPLNTWVYICWQRNGTGLYGYLNGAEQFNPSTGNAQGSPTVSTAVSNINKIGAYSSGTSYNLNGKLGPVHMYNRALSAAEISQNFNALRGRFGI